MGLPTFKTPQSTVGNSRMDCQTARSGPLNLLPFPPLFINIFVRPSYNQSFSFSFLPSLLYPSHLFSFTLASPGGHPWQRKLAQMADSFPFCFSLCLWHIFIRRQQPYHTLTNTPKQHVRPFHISLFFLPLCFLFQPISFQIESFFLQVSNPPILPLSFWLLQLLSVSNSFLSLYFMLSFRPSSPLFSHPPFTSSSSLPSDSLSLGRLHFYPSLPVCLRSSTTDLLSHAPWSISLWYQQQQQPWQQQQQMATKCKAFWSQTFVRLQRAALFSPHPSVRTNWDWKLILEGEREREHLLRSLEGVKKDLGFGYTRKHAQKHTHRH